MKGVVTRTESPFRDVDSRKVDFVIGKKKASPIRNSNIDWTECPLAKAYPSWDIFLEQVALRRQEDLKKDR
jgi:hypothetical protein